MWQGGDGLFDIRWLDRMLSVQGAGWGGGSLVYANVFARPSDETFRPHWPVGRYVARMLGGRASDAPTWSLLRRAVTVHSLGGVPMGIDSTYGVIDEHGEVHGHRGLYVVDGAAVPSATGVNPSASILAMAERNVERAIRHILSDDLWEAPEMADATPAEGARGPKR